MSAFVCYSCGCAFEKSMFGKRPILIKAEPCEKHLDLVYDKTPEQFAKIIDETLKEESKSYQSHTWKGCWKMVVATSEDDLEIA